MPYNMDVYLDGGCRGNGQSWAFGAAAAVFKGRYGQEFHYSRELPAHDYPAPTSQRAELTAVILGLEIAMQRYRALDSNPFLIVNFYCDSKYAVGCMTEWYAKWQQNGFTNAAGNPVANQDLIQEALDLEADLLEEGRVIWKWIPRSQNSSADALCNRILDDME